MNRSLTTCLLLTVALAMRAATAAPLDPEHAAIEAVALDYAHGWYAGDRTRMAGALHEAFVKRAYLPGADGRRNLTQMDRDALVEATRTGHRERYRDAAKRAEATVLNRYGNTASVRLQMDGWIDYMHLVRGEDGRWRILNVLWELEPS